MFAQVNCFLCYILALNNICIFYKQSYFAYYHVWFVKLVLKSFWIFHWLHKGVMGRLSYFFIDKSLPSSSDIKSYQDWIYCRSYQPSLYPLSKFKTIPYYLHHNPISILKVVITSRMPDTHMFWALKILQWRYAVSPSWTVCWEGRLESKCGLSCSSLRRGRGWRTVRRRRSHHVMRAAGESQFSSPPSSRSLHGLRPG